MNRLKTITIILSIGLLIWLGPFRLFAENQSPTDKHKPHDFRATKAMVVAAHPLAVKAGVQILRRGGNAIDAAIATAAALNAAEPFASGIGGGGFMVVYLAKEKKVTVINFRERAPAASQPTMFHLNGQLQPKWRRTHGLAVAVPGALAGWNYALQKYGTLSLGEVFKEAIKIAEEGFPVSDTFSSINKDEYEKLLEMDGEDSCYLHDGFPFEPGDIFRNPSLAKTLRLISVRGPEVFYKGEIAQKIVQAVQEKGGIMTMEDLSSYQPLETKPLRSTYKDFEIWTIPPPGSGGLHIIQLLSIFENLPLKEWGYLSPHYIHYFTEALRFLFADRARYLGDPEFVKVPVAKLISKKYARSIIEKIKPEKVATTYLSNELFYRDLNSDEVENTTHLCVVDEQGNIVSLTQSINHFFGSGIVPEGTGFLLNNHMDDFSRDPKSPNAPGSRRHPLSSMGPLILFHQGEPFLVLGSPGGTRIFSSLTQIILNIIEFGLGLDEAIEAPRFFSYSVNGQARPLYVEKRIPAPVLDQLRQWGHQISLRETYDKYFGGAQGILILPRGQGLRGGADSRRDGTGGGY
ncbi:gamma-glutamyltransferase [Candidatus Aminicenantes bacterium AC-334-K16]|jgi:gamma-glutamyltranspeptidase/glutathione hydrolase|nr:gamma-glutamyltransferase [Candidatus Aminicenantes bacterium AC-334-K16]